MQCSLCVGGNGVGWQREPKNWGETVVRGFSGLLLSPPDTAVHWSANRSAFSHCGRARRGGSGFSGRWRWPFCHCASLNHHRNCAQEVSFISSCHPTLPFLLPFFKTQPPFNLHSNPLKPQQFSYKPRHLISPSFQLQTSFSRQTSLCQLSKISKPLVSPDPDPSLSPHCPNGASPQFITHSSTSRLRSMIHACVFTGLHVPVFRVQCFSEAFPSTTA